MEAARQISSRPLEVKTDQKNRLQIPALVRKMLKVKPGARFNLYITEDESLHFSKAEK